MFKRFIAGIVCRLLGHRRGKLTGKVYEAETNTWHKAYYCPRCSATWFRRVHGKSQNS